MKEVVTLAIIGTICAGMYIVNHVKNPVTVDDIPVSTEEVSR